MRKSQTSSKGLRHYRGQIALHLPLARLLIAWMLVMVLFSCESHKDPFSANNSGPVITTFSFKPDFSLPDASLRDESDSLKYKDGRAYPIAITYEDAESKNQAGRTLQANFKLLTGSGRIQSDRFSTVSADQLSFNVPSQLSDVEIFFLPSAPGRVELQLQLSDGIKTSEARTTATTFFENMAPIVRFDFVVVSQVNPYQIDFDASASVDRDGEIKEYVWSFGDGTPNDTTASSDNQHKYQQAGTYPVRLMIKDDEETVGTGERIISTANQPPVADLRVDPIRGKAKLTISYNAGGSFDPDGSIASYTISFGDGATASNVSGTHEFVTDGNYRVRLIVKDNSGTLDSTATTVTVATPPIANLVVTPDSGAFPLRVQLDASGSRDPLEGGAIRAYRIFIDGQQTYTQQKVTHVFREPDDYFVTLEVENNRGLTDQMERTIRVSNTPPVAKFRWTPLHPQAGAFVTFTSLSHDPDSTDSITRHTWNFGDGTAEGAGATITHSYTTGRTYLVSLTVEDGFNGVSVKQDTVEVQ